jgi:SPP1 family phage portal protein
MGNIRVFQGRRKILTSCLPENMQPEGFEGMTLNETTLPNEINRAMSIHQQNREDIQTLRNIYKGNQNIYKRLDDGVDRFVNNMVCVNYANAFTRQIVGYTYPSGIQFVPILESVRPDVEKINRFMKSENKNMLDKIMETEQSMFGTHFRAILPDTVMPDECPFEILPLPADDTFVAYSAYNPNFPVYGLTMYPILAESNGAQVTKYVYKVYTSNMCYTYVSMGNTGVLASDFKSAVPHILGNVPIIEYPNNEFRMGDWEMAIDLFDAINEMSSDCLNDVEQTVLSYLVLLGVDTPSEEEFKQMRKYRTLALRPVQGITNMDAKFITAQLDGQSAELLRAYFENALRVVVGIPDRNSSGGGDTGEAINAKNGWREIDTVAKNKTMFTEASERQLLRIALQILSPKYVSEELSVLDIDISIPRNKNDNLQTKTQAGSEMYQMHMPKTDIVKIMDITTDVEGLVKRWNEEEQKWLERSASGNKANEKTEKSDSDNILAKSVAMGANSIAQ